jgi:hypothetical protein
MGLTKRGKIRNGSCPGVAFTQLGPL